MTLSTCEVCRLYFLGRPYYSKCLRCGAGIYSPDRVSLAFAVQEAWRHRLWIGVIVTLGMAGITAGLVTWVTGGSWVTTRGPDHGDLLRGSMFFELMFAGWIALCICWASFLGAKKPADDADMETQLKFLGYQLGR